MRDEYDFSGGSRGKHAQAYSQRTKLVPLEKTTEITDSMTITTDSSFGWLRKGKTRE